MFRMPVCNVKQGKPDERDSSSSNGAETGTAAARGAEGAPGGAPGPRVSIILACRNEAAHLEPCLRSILAQEKPPGGFELIVADGMSDDGTRLIAGRMAAQYKILKVIDNPGRIVSRGLNLAISAAKGDVIVRMDAHTEYEPDYVRQCVQVLAESAADNVGGPARTKAETYLQKAIAAAYHSPFSVGGARFHNVEYEGPVDTVTYGCWPKESFEKFGLFDEELVRNQDDEHNLRISRGGGLVWQSPRIQSWYRPRSSLPDLFRQYMQYGYWKVRVIQKHRLPASIRHLVPGAFLLSLAILSLASLGSVTAFICAVLLAAAYGACVLMASAVTAAKTQPALFPVLPLVFAAYHFGYGYGFLRGLVDFIILKKQPGGQFSALTRQTATDRGIRAPTRSGGRYPQSAAKRWLDVFGSACGLVLLSPLWLVIAALIKLQDHGPVFFRQTRIGRFGRPFLMWKFRTMIPQAESTGPLVTQEGDARITRVGRLLRKSKLDELPQLWNVLKGDMSLVGPRPEIDRYARQYTDEQRQILQYKPGVTDLASLYFHHEEILLSRARDLEAFYLRYCVPRKISLNLQYAASANLLTDVWIILQTVCPYWLRIASLYGLILGFSFWLTAEILGNFNLPFGFWRHYGWPMALVVCLQLAFLERGRQCNPLLGFFDFHELPRLSSLLLLAGLAAFGVSRLQPLWNLPYSFLPLNLLLSVTLLGGFHIFLRKWREWQAPPAGASRRVAIVGANSAGRLLAFEWRTNRTSGRKVVAFFDDDCRKWHKRCDNIAVVGMPECLLNGWSEQVDEVVLALSDTSENRRREIGALLQHHGFHVVNCAEFLQLIELVSYPASQVRQAERAFTK